MSRLFLCSLFFILCSLCLVPVFGVSLEELVGVERAGVFRASDELITELQFKNPSPRLLPRHEALQYFMAGNIWSLDPNLLVETLSVYHKPAASHTEWSNAQQLDLFNQLTALSTLAGIQYYSESRKAMRTFYETSQVIDSPESKKPLPDPVHSVLPNALVLHARQKDLTFGDNIYRFDYAASADAIFLMQENVTAMNVGIIPAVGKNKCRTIIAIIDTGDSLVLYAAAMAKAVALPGMGDRIGASFTNRVEAILQWFTAHIRTFSAP
ncbi:MAG: hypothetical protein FWD36_02040 [Treponema sp.]|nr:hypothetical protein [Treponema sp.]